MGRLTVKLRRKLLFVLLLMLVLVALPFLRPGTMRPVNRPILRYRDPGQHQFERLELLRGKHEDLVVLAFSGGGTRAAAFSYGVLETLRRIKVRQGGVNLRLLDEVDVVFGISGGSFTALAYGLYGERLFSEYERRFLKRNVQRDLTLRVLNPLNWRALVSSGWGRSELAADFYDEILFHGATFADLERAGGPAIAVGATDLGTGARVVFVPQNFDIMCADLSGFRIARAAAASSAVPVVLSPLTIDNYGGSCGYREPEWLRPFIEATSPPRPAGRVLKRLQELRAIDEAGRDRYLHLVDGAVADNLGLRGVLDYLEAFEALRSSGFPTPLDHVRRIIIFVVNSVSTPSFDWNESENPPPTLSILTKTAGVPVDRYANESVELLKDIDARWSMLREMRDSFARSRDKNTLPAYVQNAPDADIYPIEVSFQALKDETERERLNQLPTSFHLPDEAVDRLRSAAAKILLGSTELRRALAEEWVGVDEIGPSGSSAKAAWAPSSWPRTRGTTARSR
jgi:NTE family protein